MMLHYFREVKEGAELEVTCQLLEHDAKRLRVWFEMRVSGADAPCAASEQLLLSVSQIDGRTRRALERPRSRRARRPRQTADWPSAGRRRQDSGIRLKKA